MPIARHFVDLGDGVEQLLVDDSLDTNSSDKEATRRLTRCMRHIPSTPPESAAKASIGLTTPPRSGSKKAQSGFAPRSTLSHNEYESKLKVKDSKGRQLSRLAFRWYDDESQGLNSATQIRAGLFRKPTSPITPPKSDHELKSALLSHLIPEKKHSPFISVFENFLPALHRALKSRKEAHIAIIDLRRVVEDSTKRFPDATEVVWPIKVVVKQYGFKLRHNYKGYEWLIHGIVESSAIIQTVKVSDLRAFARTGRVRQMRDILEYISLQQHAFGLLNRLETKLPKTGYRTGTLVGKVLDHVHIPKKYKKLVARKIMNMIKFEGIRTVPRARAYLRGVYGMPMTDSDREIDADDDFLVDSDDGYVSDETYSENASGERFGQCIKSLSTNDEYTSTDDESDTASSENNNEDEQALLDAQLHATENEWLNSVPSSKMLRMSHIDIPKLTTTQLAEFKGVPSSASSSIIDLTSDYDDEQVNDTDKERASNATDEQTNDADNEQADDDVIEVAPSTNDEDVIVVASATRANRTMDLAIRSTSVRSTVGPRGLGRLEADADAEIDVMEVIRFD